MSDKKAHKKQQLNISIDEGIISILPVGILSFFAYRSATVPVTFTTNSRPSFFEVSINLSTNFSTLRYVYVVSDILANASIFLKSPIEAGLGSVLS